LRRTEQRRANLDERGLPQARVVRGRLGQGARSRSGVAKERLERSRCQSPAMHHGETLDLAVQTFLFGSLLCPSCQDVV